MTNRMQSLICSALLLCAALYAGPKGRLQQDNSDYGNLGPDCTAGLTPGYSCDLTGPLIGQDFAFSGNSNFDVNFQLFDFQVTANTGPFTLTLSSTEPFVADQQLTSGDISQQIWGFGMFICGDGDFANSLCTPSTADTSGVTSVPTTSDGTESKVTFNVPGNSQGFTFFAMVDQIATDPVVTATVTPSSSVPEPVSIPFLLAAGMVVVALGGRRLARLL